jgi:hypothetical protein
LFVTDGIGNAVKILEGQGQVFRESAIVMDDAEHGAAGTVGLEAAAAELANGPESVGSARNVDFSGDATADPFGSPAGGHVANFGDLADEFMPGNAAKSVVAAQNFDIRVANSRQAYADECPSGPKPGQRP